MNANDRRDADHSAPIDIEIVEVREVEPRLRQVPVPFREIGRRRKDDDLAIFFKIRALEGIAEHLRDNLKRELGGLLIGNFCDDGKRKWLDVSDFIPAAHTEGGGAHLKFTIATWAALDEVIDAKWPKGEKISVGWYHSIRISACSSARRTGGCMPSSSRGGRSVS